mgnify:CR=1 FL=1
MAKKATNKKENLPMEEVLWKACDALRGSIEPSEYKHVVLSLIFLKYAGFHFDKRRREIINDGLEDFVDSVEFYAAKNVFYLPETARWTYIKENAKQPNASLLILSDIWKDESKVASHLTIIIVRWEYKLKNSVHCWIRLMDLIRFWNPQTAMILLDVSMSISFPSLPLKKEKVRGNFIRPKR